jgi:hypothetical protein
VSIASDAAHAGQTSYSDRGPVPDVGKFRNFDHITFYVNNAKQGWSTRAPGLSHPA